MRRPTEGADIVADYERLGLTLGRHPLALLRPRLAKMKMRTSIELQTTPSGRIARACGIVTHRQRPQTAKGSVFVTIEDETGPVNIIFWNDIFERERKVVVGSTLLGVQGVWQSEAGVMHLLAKRATDYSQLARAACHFVARLPLAAGFKTTARPDLASAVLAVPLVRVRSSTLTCK